MQGPDAKPTEAKNLFTISKTKANSQRPLAAIHKLNPIRRRRVYLPGALFPTFACHLGAGGGDRDRTDDLLLAKQMLSQLSYAPDRVVGLGRLELPTSRLSGVRSNQLSYRPAPDEIDQRSGTKRNGSRNQRTKTTFSGRPSSVL